MFKLSQKGIVHVLLLIFLLLGLIGGVYGVQYARTVLEPKASEQNYIQIVDKDGNQITETTSVDVFLKISLPPGWVPEANVRHSLTDQSYTDPKCPIRPVCCFSPLQTCTSNSECKQKGYQWCNQGYCINESYVEATNSCQPLAILNKLIIYNHGSSGERMELTDNIEEYLDKPIPWKLPELTLYEEKGVKRYITVGLHGRAGAAYQTTVDITLKKGVPATASVPPVSPEIPHIIKSPIKASTTQEYLLDLYIDEQFLDPHKVKKIVMTSLDDLINPKLKESKIDKHITVNNYQTVESLGSCDTLWKEPVVKRASNKIIMFITYEYPMKFGAWAQVANNVICLPGRSENYSNTLMHELGHIFGLPDYYLQNVSHENDEVAKIGIRSKIKDVMWDSGYAHFDPISAEIINRSSAYHVTDVFDNWLNFVPETTKLKIIDGSNLPIPNVQVEIFPQVFSLTSDKLPLLISEIPDDSSVTALTDTHGIIDLGNTNNIFIHSKIKSIVQPVSVLLKLNNKGDIRYAALTISDLNIRYFEFDDLQETTIPMIFPSLAKTPDKPVTLRIGQTTTEVEISEGEQQMINEHIYQELKVNGIIDSPGDNN